jgi:putative membrane protein
MKMKHVYLASAFAAAVFLGACTKNDDNNSNTNTSTVNGQDTTFLLQASQSNNAEISLGTLALTNASSDSVRSFAQMMIQDHTAAQANLRSMVDSVRSTLNLSDSLSANQMATRDSLMSLSGAAFDSAYIASQVVSHQNTLAAFDAEIANGQNGQVKGYATRYRPAIQSHLNMADSLMMRLQP